MFYSFEMQRSWTVENLLCLSGSVFRTGVQSLTEIMKLKVLMIEAYKTMTHVTQQKDHRLVPCNDWVVRLSK